MQENTNVLNLKSIYQIGNQYRKIIILVLGIITVITAIILWLTPNRYSSTAVFFPASEHIADNNVAFNKDQGANEGIIYGYDYNVDHVFAIATSPTVMNFIMQKYKLVEHYGYKKSDAKCYEKAAKKYAKYIKLRRTELNSLELKVIDEDYIVAAHIADDILKKTESIYHGFIAHYRQSMTKNYQVQIDQYIQIVDKLSDSLAKVRDQYRFYGLINPSRKESNILSNGSINGKGFELIQNLEERKEQFLSDISKFQSLKGQMEIGKADSTEFLFVIERPTPSMVKDGPLRTIILLTTILISFIILLFILVIFSFLKNQTKS